MKLFYSIREISSIIGENQYRTAHMLKVEGVLMTYQGEPADLSGWTGGVWDCGNSVYILGGYYDAPSPSSVLVLADSLPVSWKKKIESSEAEPGGLISEDVTGGPEEGESPTAAAIKKDERGLTKAEILAAHWPLPDNAPALESILNKIPKWVSEACIKVGKVGKGQSGSHLWNPAVLAVCLATRTPHKQWICNRVAMTNLIRSTFSDYLDEWTVKQEML